MNLFQEIRLVYVDWCLAEARHVNRSDLMRDLGVSEPTAAATLREFARRWPDGIYYDASAKKYLRRAGVVPVFSECYRRAVSEVCREHLLL